MPSRESKCASFTFLGATTGKPIFKFRTSAEMATIMSCLSFPQSTNCSILPPCSVSLMTTQTTEPLQRIAYRNKDCLTKFRCLSWGRPKTFGLWRSRGTWEGQIKTSSAVNTCLKLSSLMWRTSTWFSYLVKSVSK